MRFTDSGLKCFSRSAVFTTPNTFNRSPKTDGHGSNGADELCQGGADSDGSIVLVGRYVSWSPTSTKDAKDRLHALIDDGDVLQDHTTLVTTTEVDLISGSVIHSINQHEQGSTNTGMLGNMAGTTSEITQQWTDIYIKTRPNKCASILYRTVTRS